MTRDYRELVSKKWDEKKFLCVGLDSDLAKIPKHLQQLGPREGVLAFNVAIVEATKDIAGAFKLNSAFYEAHGADGWTALQATCNEIRALASDVPIIIDAKRADIGNTNEGYVAAFFDAMGADAITVHPYLGRKSLEPFLKRKDKGVIVLCRTSNEGSGEFQDLVFEGEPLYKKIARTVETEWNEHGNCWLVVGATYPTELAQIRATAPQLPFLIPGIGTQGGNIESAVKKGVTTGGRGILLNASRSIIFASEGNDFAEKAAASAQELHGAIQKAL